MASATVAATEPQYLRVRCCCPACACDDHEASIRAGELPNYKVLSGAAVPAVLCDRCLYKSFLPSSRVVGVGRPSPAAGPAAAERVMGEAERFKTADKLDGMIYDRLVALAESVRREPADDPLRKFDAGAIRCTQRASDALRIIGVNPLALVAERFERGDWGETGRLADGRTDAEARTRGRFGDLLDQGSIAVQDGRGIVRALYKLAANAKGKPLDHPEVLVERPTPGGPPNGVLFVKVTAWVDAEHPLAREAAVALAAEVARDWRAVGY